MPQHHMNIDGFCFERALIGEHLHLIHQRTNTVCLIANQAREGHILFGNRGLQQLSRAAELVGQLEQVAANDVETLMVRGVLELQLGRATEALRSFSTAVDRGDETHRAGLGVAMALLATERAADAWSVLAALGKRFPEVSQVAHLVFRVGAQLGRWSEMVDPLERYVAIHQDDLAIRFATASVCVRRGDLERARHHYDALACHDPSYCGLQDLARELAMSA